MLSIDAHPGAKPARRGRREAAADRLASTMQYYEANASAYAAATARIDVSERIGQFVEMLPRGARVLDAGCGAGRDLLYFRNAGLEAVGLDLSASLGAIARKVSGCEVYVGDLASPPPMAAFDGIWAMASLLHTEREAVGDALAALSSLLQPGGLIFSSVKRGTGEIVDDTGRWFTLYDEAQWVRRLRDADLEIIEITGEPPADGAATGSVTPGWISSLARRA